MKWICILLFLSTFLFSGCGIRERETALQKREAQLVQREQEILLKEESLQLREKELQSKAQRLDSTARDSAFYNPTVLGKWSVRMTCIEAGCPGSAVGDTKYETWELTYQNNQVIAKALVNNNLVRVYTGSYKNNTLELTESEELSPASPGTKMLLRLTLINENTMEGQREIVRADCRIIYALQLDKQAGIQ